MVIEDMDTVMVMDPDIMAILTATTPIARVMDIPIVTGTIITVDQGTDTGHGR
jgi:hypothetical protein